MDGWNKLIIKKQRRNKRIDRDLKPVIGWDSETDYNGNIWLLANSENRYILYPDLDMILTFMFNKKYRNTLNLFFNLQFDISVILKMLPNDKLIEIVDTGETKYKGYKLKYIEKKYFSITHQKNSVAFFDIAQFFAGFSLQTASVEFLNDSKNVVEKEEFSNPQYIKKHQKELIEYCLKDCELTKRLGDYLFKMFKDVGVVCNQPYSTAYLSQVYFIKKCDIPKFSDVPYIAQKYAFEAYRGGRFEIRLRGMYNNPLYKYDINSAYPEQIADLIDIRRGEWVEVEKYSKKAYYGYYYIEWTPKNNLEWQPLPVQNKGVIIFPKAKMFYWVTKKELELAKTLGKVKVCRGVEFYPNEIIYPFKKEIEKMYNNRLELKKQNNPLQYVLKILMNSFYGKMIQRVNNTTGNLFLPVYATEITANTRIKIFNALKRYNKEIIAVFTDCVISKSPLDLPVSKELGEWDLEIYDRGLFIQSGVYHLEGKQSISKFRGFSTGISLLDLLKNINGIKKAVTFSFYKEKPLKLKECLKHNFIKVDNGQGHTVELNINKNYIGRFVKIEKQLDINGDIKRNWHYNFKSIYDMLNNYHYGSPLNKIDFDISKMYKID